jgi:TonB family protein
MRAAMVLLIAVLVVGCATSGEPRAVPAPPDSAPLDADHYCAEAVPRPAPPSPDGSAAVVQLPRVIREVLAAYPREPCLARREGDVIMKVYVKPTGTVGGVQILRSAGTEFDATAAAALFRFQFTPACLSTGKPAPVSIQYKYLFRQPGGC